jgi:hypothetical protein
MIKNLLVAASCLFTVVSASSAASAQQLPEKAPALCLASASPAQGDLFAFKKTAKACGLYCGPGGTTPTESTIGAAGYCSSMTSSLSTRLRNDANAACQNLTGRMACNVVLHLTGCLPDGGTGLLIEYGYATYGCYDTTC